MNLCLRFYPPPFLCGKAKAIVVSAGFPEEMLVTAVDLH